ncbi:MAG: DUF1566 domain-containing protein [Rhodanobacteraceae bacterium]
MSKTLIKIAADGTEMPADSKGHVAVLIPELKLMFPAHDIVQRGVRWADIQKPCEDLQLAGFNDWRPVTIEEGFLFCDRTRFDPAFDPEFFPGITPTWHWTSTVDAEAPSSYAWYVFLHYGSADVHNRGGSGRVLACRAASQ